MNEAARDLQDAVRSSRALRAATSFRGSTMYLDKKEMSADYLEISSDESDNDEDFSACSTLSDINEECNELDIPLDECLLSASNDNVAFDQRKWIESLQSHVEELEQLKEHVVGTISCTIARLDSFIATITGSSLTKLSIEDCPLSCLDHYVNLWTFALHNWAMEQKMQIPPKTLSSDAHVQVDINQLPNPSMQQSRIFNEQFQMIQEECASRHVENTLTMTQAYHTIAKLQDDRAMLQLQVDSMERRLKEALNSISLNHELALEHQKQYATQLDEIHQLKAMNLQVLDALIHEDSRFQERQVELDKQQSDLHNEQIRLHEQSIALECFKQSILKELIDICTQMEAAPKSSPFQHEFHQLCTKHIYNHAPNTA